MTRNLRRSVCGVRLVAETLENREGPSSLTDPLALIVSYPAYVDVRKAENPAADARDDRPVITDARAINGPFGAVTLLGKATDDMSLAGCLVTIGGAGVSETAVVESNGKFSITFQRPTDSDFVVQVTVVDSDGNVSEPVTVLVSGI